MSALIANHGIVSHTAVVRILAFLAFAVALAHRAWDCTPRDCIASGTGAGISYYPVAVLVTIPAHPIFACGGPIHFYPGRPKWGSAIACQQACARNRKDGRNECDYWYDS